MVMLRLVTGIDLRRPASWIALASGLCAGWLCSVWTSADQSIVGSSAMLLAAVAAVVAIGEPPVDLCRPTAAGSIGGWLWIWASERAVWPLTGVMLAALVVAGGDPQVIKLLAMAALGTLLAVVTTVVGRLSGATAADAASLTLVLAAASAAVGVAIDAWLTAIIPGAFVAWLLFGLLAWAWSRSLAATPDSVSAAMSHAEYGGGGDVLRLDLLPSAGGLRQILTMVAMGTALVAMAVWLVVEPAGEQNALGPGDLVDRGMRVLTATQRAVAWWFCSAAWFVALAVPHATLRSGIAGATGWEKLFRTAAGPSAAGQGVRWFLRIPPLGSSRFAGGVALTQAAMLGWPVLVSAVLSLPTPAGARLPLGIVVGLGLLAALLVAGVAIGFAMTASRETTFAASLALVVTAVVGTLVTVSSFQREEVPVSPSPPRLMLELLHRPGNG